MKDNHLKYKKIITFKKELSFLVLVVLLFFQYAYSNPIDSLKSFLKKSTGKERVEILLQLGELQLRPELKEALRLANEALELSNKLNSQYLIASSYQLIGNAHYRLKEYDKGENYQKSALNIFLIINDSVKVAALYDNLGDTYEKSGRIDSAIILFNHARKIFEKIGNKASEALSYSSIGLLYWRKGQNSEALKYHFKAYGIRKALKIDASIAMSANNIGVVYWRLGNYQKALEYYSESLSLREKLKDRKGIIVANNNIGYIYLRLNYFDKANAIFENSLKESKEIDYPFGAAYSNHLLSILYLNRKEFYKSIQFSEEAIKDYYEVYELNSVAYAMNYLGEAYAGLGNFNKAKEIFYAALDTARKANDKFSLATTLLNFAKINVEQNELKAAKENLNKTLEIAYPENFIDLIIDCNYLYSGIMKKLGDPAKALEYYEKYTESLNNLRLEQLSTNINEWELRYRSDQKEYENILLRQENKLKEAEVEKEKIFRNRLVVILLITVLFLLVLGRFYYFKRKTANQILQQKKELEILNQKLAQTNVNLEEDIRTKDRLFSVIAHDLKSPFNSLLNYSDILISESEDLSKQQVIDYGKIVHKSSKTLLEITENLLNWARLQFRKISIKKEIVELKDIVQSVVEFHGEYAKSKNVKVEMHIDADLHLKSDKEMLHVIFRNLISNAIKFSYKNGLINISAMKKNGSFDILIKDGGVGIAKEKLGRLFSLEYSESTTGTNNEKGTGIGLIICKDFIDALGGKIMVESEIGRGTTFILSIPFE